MKTLKPLLGAASAVALVILTAQYAAAQAQSDSKPQSPPPPPAGSGGQPGTPGGGMGGFGGGGRMGNFDPEQFRQRIMDQVRDQLEITNEVEWKAIEPLVTKVMDAQREKMMSGLGGMVRSFGRGFGGGRGGGFGGMGGGGLGAMFGEANPELESLNKAIDNKAGKEEIKSAISKVRDVRQARDQKLKQAQDDLRKVLTLRQEAIAIMNGWLD